MEPKVDPETAAPLSQARRLFAFSLDVVPDGASGVPVADWLTDHPPTTHDVLLVTVRVSAGVVALVTVLAAATPDVPIDETPLYTTAQTREALVHVPDVSELEAATLYPIRMLAVEEPPELMFVQPEGSVGGVELAARPAKMMMMSPAAWVPRVTEVDAAETALMNEMLETATEFPFNIPRVNGIASKFLEKSKFSGLTIAGLGGR